MTERHKVTSVGNNVIGRKTAANLTALSFASLMSVLVGSIHERLRPRPATVNEKRLGIEVIKTIGMRLPLRLPS